MIKGVNRQMIEINDTGNIYFERALLVIRPGFTDQPAEQLQREGREYLRQAGGYTGLDKNRRRTTKRRGLYALLTGLGVVAGLTGGLVIAAVLK